MYKIEINEETKYTDSKTCVFCGKYIKDEWGVDYRFLCRECTESIENEIYNLLKEKSEYKHRIKEVRLLRYDHMNTPTNDVTTIIINVTEYIGSTEYVLVRIPTAKMLEVRDLQDEDLLFTYIEIHIKAGIKNGERFKFIPRYY